PKSVTRTMFSCSRRLVVFASCTKRAAISSFSDSSGRSSLTATCLLRNACSATHTTPMPPSPSWRTNRYLPSTTVPASSDCVRGERVIAAAIISFDACAQTLLGGGDELAGSDERERRFDILVHRPIAIEVGNAGAQHGVRGLDAGTAFERPMEIDTLCRAQ